ncbi:MAG: phosphatidylinositol-specific phospholipase C domain-containing protein [Acidobacteriota bacterium]|nr:phosphatidylinositol-specific phospholipase C domain-containing protein [Acidobacteriota bacterium]
MSIHANVNPVFHGLGLQYDHGETPAVAITRTGRVVEVHRTANSYRLYHRVGDLQEATIVWKQSRRYGTGATPDIAVNNNNAVVEVHKNEATGRTLYYYVGKLTGDRVNWGQHPQSIEYDKGVRPAVALNDADVVVEVHESQGKKQLWYNLGRVRGNEVDWTGSGHIGAGGAPRVALNNAGVVVEVHESGRGAIAYRVGHLNRTKIFGANLRITGGQNPAVALTDDGTVIVTYEFGNRNLCRMVGTVNGDTIDWLTEPLKYDDGMRSSVAASSTKMSVEVHEGDLLTTLWFSTSLFTNRASWMKDRLSTLGKTRLGDLVLPGSHDSGMYLSGIAALGKTQQLSLYGQLTAGVRYFDLRIMRIGRSGPFVIYHGPIIGPYLAEVLKDIRRYAIEKHRELIILKLYFPMRSAGEYQMLVKQISDSIGDWLVTSKPPGKQRLADVTLEEYVESVAEGPAILVVVDGEYAVNASNPGFWVYRNWTAGALAAAEGDLRVFDRWSDREIFEKMKNHQFDQFEKYTGKMQNAPTLPCDLFLLSWTLTPGTGVWFAAKEANRRLGEYILKTSRRNQFGQMINLLYVDYVEYARVTDVALFRNAEVTTSDAASAPKRAKKTRKVARSSRS